MLNSSSHIREYRGLYITFVSQKGVIHNTVMSKKYLRNRQTPLKGLKDQTSLKNYTYLLFKTIDKKTWMTLQVY